MKSKVQLELVGRLPRKAGGSVGHMTLDGKHVFLVNEDAGLQVVDASNPTAPRSPAPTSRRRPWAPSPLLPLTPMSLKATICCECSMFPIPRSRVSSARAHCRTCSRAGRRRKHVYVSMSDSLRVLDVSDPALPKEVGVCGKLELAGSSDRRWQVRLRCRRLQRHEDYRRFQSGQAQGNWLV